jgi:AraC-like DNA-binding protein
MLISTMPAMQFGWIGKAAMGAADRGIDVERLLVTSGIGGARRRIGPETWLDPAEYALMSNLLINTLGGRTLGTARHRGTASMGVRLACAATDLADAVSTMFTFYRLTGCFCDVTWTPVAGVAAIEIRIDRPRSVQTTIVEEMAAIHLQMVLSYCLGFFLPLKRFSSPASQHPNRDSKHPFLKCDVERGPFTKLEFQRKYLSFPVREMIRGKSLVDVVMFWLSLFAKEHNGPSSMERATLSADLYRLLVLEDLSFGACCSQLAVGEREVRRILATEGNSFRVLRRAAILERARPYLVADVSADDAAIALGYSDARSLRRALKLAGGLSLSDMRRTPAPVEIIGNPTVISSLRQQLAYRG